MADSAAILLDKIVKTLRASGMNFTMAQAFENQITALYHLTYKEAYAQAIQDQKEKCGCEPLDPDAVSVDDDDDGDIDGSDMWGV